MNKMQMIAASPWKESFGICKCCGRKSKTIWGDLSDSEITQAVYFVQWIVDAPEHLTNIDLVMGRWGEDAGPDNRILVSLLFQPGNDGGSFMIIDGEGRPADSRTLCKRALRRAEIIGTPMASEVFGLVDALWLTEPRLDEVKALNNAV